jgi:histone H3/H4
MTSTPPDPRSPKEAWDMQHRILATEPIVWLLKADSLMAAFEVLVADDERRAGQNLPRRVQSVAYMLAGFAIENLLKGLLIAARTPLDKAGRFTLKSHDLLDLSAEVGCQLDDSNRRLLERMQEFAIWTGRYPIPLSSEPMRPRPTPDGSFSPRTYHIQGEDWPAIRVLFARLRDDLQRVRQASVAA